jgi:glutaminyl-tRNA synthetase
VSAAQAVDAEVRLYDRLFLTEAPGSTGDPLAELNPSSLVTARAKAEPSLAAARPGDRFQLERLGFFVVDESAQPGALVLNRTVALKDSWAKIEARPAKAQAPQPAKRDGAAQEATSKPAEPARAGAPAGKAAKDRPAPDAGSPKPTAERPRTEPTADAGETEAAVDAVLAESADMVARYRAGNANLIGPLVALVMKKTGGKASPRLVNEILRAKLSA